MSYIACVGYVNDDMKTECSRLSFLPKLAHRPMIKQMVFSSQGYGRLPASSLSFDQPVAILDAYEAVNPANDE